VQECLRAGVQGVGVGVGTRGFVDFEVRFFGDVREVGRWFHVIDPRGDPEVEYEVF
jgi:hypothetical protein